ncbi:hypothetical protein DSO57_1007824 [Entomophthora muscae]|uniref:Uncharacterized protein n=1 Tax=Entomophthora muscae TaxID=34485 RepID=A0ACC2S9B6_9FUNG|nr:hypothetical protein DSO57_1007824 [Entomophthora muscae]
MEAWAVRYLSQLPLLFLPPAFSGPPAYLPVRPSFFVGNCSKNNNLDHSLLFTRALNCPRQLPSLARLPACLPAVQKKGTRWNNVVTLVQGGYVDTGAHFPLVLVLKPSLLEQTFLDFSIF